MENEIKKPHGGRRPGSGRKPGTQNRVTRTIKSAIERAFTTLQRDPKAKLTAWARQNPTEFYKLAARLLPQEVRSQVQFANCDVSGFTDDELGLIAAGKATDELLTRLIASSRGTSSSRA